MKDVTPIWDVVETAQGKFIGDNKAHGRVTVEPDWWLNATSDRVGNSSRGPFRYAQLCDDSQTEIEIPNVRTISIDRSVDSDAATMTLTIDNQKMYDFNGATPEEVEDPNQLGRPGYFWFGRGKSEDSLARWGQITNEWEDILVPNALLRTYQGYGGHDETIEDAISGGYITKTGVWLIDTIDSGTNGQLSVRCRDLAKLLIDQQLFAPLVPSKLYPLEYCRWKYTQVPAGFKPKPPKTVTSTSGGAVALTYDTSTADAWYGFNASIHGHRGSDAVDFNTDTFALSVGNSHVSRPFATDYFQFNAGGNAINKMFLRPWAGNYICYISIMENGVWQSTNGELIPHDPSGLPVDSAADIPYVMVFGVGWEEDKFFDLPRTFRAQKIRVTFKGHTQSQWGPYYYRVGLREVAAAMDESTSTSTVADDSLPWTFSFTHTPLDGYLVVDDAGTAYNFGDARQKAKTDANGFSTTAQSIAATEDGRGYYILEENGRVHTYGSATYYGDLVSTGVDALNRAVDIATKPDGTGYWIVCRDGRVYNFGDTINGGNISTTTAAYNMMAAAPNEAWAIQITATAIESTSTGDGYWVINGPGEVFAFGDATDYGDTPNGQWEGPLDWARGFARTSDDGGYWILHASGRIFTRGNAEHFGDLNPIDGLPKEPWGGDNSQLMSVFRRLSYDIVPSDGDTGYWVLQADGMISAFGDAPYFGGPAGGGQTRSDGNYKDYTDIVKEILLWSGFLCYADDMDGSQPPPVHGNLESTGIYADECLGADVFDKKTPIDAINTLKEIVGYHFWIDDEGGARFESPNWWRTGNIFDDGSYTEFIPEIDEANTLTDYSMQYNDVALRSEIIISNRGPEAQNADVVTTRYIPPTSTQLRGIIKPAMWSNDVFHNPEEQQTMAELISLHIWFSQRTGQVTCVANPNIQINDQVRIFERQTSESYIHYVRGVQTKHDLITGEYTMTLETNWLGTGDQWVITADNVDYPREQIQITDTLANFLKKNKSASTEGVEYGRIIEATSKTGEAYIEDEEPGGAGYA